MNGVYTALVTPFTPAGEIDWPGFDRLLEQQRIQGVDGLVICGTTGETPTLLHDEKTALLRRAREKLKDSGLDLVAGTGSNSTSETISFTREAASLGYTRFLVVTPYYNRPSQRGLLAHYRAVADATEGEVILYNVPGRTGVSLAPETIAELSAHSRITGLKEASGNLTLLAEIQNALKVKGTSIDLISGDDATYFDFIRAGGVGTISVASHLLGRAMKRILVDLREGKPESAGVLNERCMPLFRDLFIDSNPVPVKFCLSVGGLISDTVRLPLTSLVEGHRQLLREDLARWDWLDGALA